MFSSPSTILKTESFSSVVRASSFVEYLSLLRLSSEIINADTRGYYPLTEFIKSHDQALYDMVCRDALEPREATVSECFKRIASIQPIEDIRQSASYEIKSLERKGNLKKSDFYSLTREKILVLLLSSYP